VVEILRREAEPVVLVGHSMGGAVITGVAEAAPASIAKLVYLTAFLGPSGVSMSGALSASAGGRPVIPFDERSLDVLYHDCPADDVALARLCVTPQALEPLTAPIAWTAERWGQVPRAFVGCRNDKVFAIADQRARAATVPDTEFVELDCGHSPFFAMPEILTDTLEALASRSGRP
jgi:pimeloyl-ACP methyl ester carboxylesterase